MPIHYKEFIFAYFLNLPLITSFSVLLLSCVSIGVEIIMTFPKHVSHLQEVSQEDVKKSK